MTVTLIRLLILYTLILGCMRLMGRRQIGELQPSELVITMLLSEIASIPLENTDIPLLNSIVVILVLTALEVLLSALCLKSDRTRKLLQGSPMPVVWNGKPIQKTLKTLRLTIDDLLEALREKDVFRITDVQLAIVEANGKLTLQLKPQMQNTTAELMKIPAPQQGIPCPIVYDGSIQKENFAYCNMTDEKFQAILRQSGLRTEEIFLLTVDTLGSVHYVRKEHDDA
ncbi:MAG: DUF421 domain-containing protein [Clostridia bacterium]|nr:DUF421 domain-containing protein [Clostridia bacterium]